MNASPASKKVKLDPASPSNEDEDPKDQDDLEREHCTICLQSFLDRTIVPVCAHEFCFECILLWSEQSRKCPLCSRSFDNEYLIHHIRSQFDYQKHYLPPSRSSPPTDESRVNRFRHARRERQWGRRQREQHEEVDRLDRAIVRRRWIYQHHLYAKHVASNSYTRYRPFPTPTQFAASPDLISRMTAFLRRELRVWPNLDVEFLTAYTISLMKSIDIRSESAVKLLSEFLDLDMSYVAGERHLNAEHFAHEIYSYLRSPYRDLYVYDQTAQYDIPPEIPPPQEIERGSRWSAEPSPSPRSRSRSGSNDRFPVFRRHDSVGRSPTPRQGRGSSAEARCEDRPSRRDRHNRSPLLDGGGDPRYHPSGRRCDPPDDARDTLRDGHSRPGGMSYPVASSSRYGRNNNGPHHQGDEKGKNTVNVHERVPATNATDMMTPQMDDTAAGLAVGGARLINAPLEGTGDDYVDNDSDGSSANPHQLRKHSAGWSAYVHPRNRTLSESVQAYLSRPALPRHSTKRSAVSGQVERNTAIATTDAPPSLLLRLTDGPADPGMSRLSDFPLAEHLRRQDRLQ